MSRGFDLIRRHLVGRTAGEDEGASPPQGADVVLVPEGTERAGADPVGNFVPAAAPPPFDPVRVANTPPPPRPVRPKPTPRNIEPPKPAPSAATPSQTLRHTQLPEILRPRHNDAGAQTAPPAVAQPATPAPAPIPAPPAPRQGPPQAPPQDQPVTSEASSPRPDRARLPAGTSRQTPAGTLRAGAPRTITKRIDRTNARAARRHSVFVALMKGLLPGLVLGLAGVFFFYSYDFQPIALPGNVKFDPGKVSVSTDGIRMVAPKLTGVDDKEQTFEIKADEAIQDRADPAKVTLLGIDARVNLTDGGTIGFSAQKGVYNTDLNQIWLDDELEIRSSEGYVAQLSEAQVDFKNGLMVSNKPVLIFTNDGVINSNSIQVLDGGKKVIFSGGVTLNLNGSAGETQ